MVRGLTYVGTPARMPSAETALAARPGKSREQLPFGCFAFSSGVPTMMETITCAVVALSCTVHSLKMNRTLSNRALAVMSSGNVCRS